MINQSLLDAICRTSTGRTASAKFLPFLNQYLPALAINTPRRIAAFLAQTMHESSEFTATVENLNYSAEGLAGTWKRFRKPDGTPTEQARLLARKPEAIANVVYADRYGNGPEVSGEGWKYRGRGLIQTTFKDNYRTVSKGLAIDVVLNPDILAEPDLAVASACVYWDTHHLNALADAGDIDGITRAINPAMKGAAERSANYIRILAAMEKS